MRQMGFVAAVICMLLDNQGVFAQGFWYLPPGGDFSYRYGIDLGNGFGYGFGFGFGYGSAVSPESAAAGAVADLTRFQGQFSVMGPASVMGDEDDDPNQDPEMELTVYQQMAQSVERQRARKSERVIVANEVGVRRVQVRASHSNSNPPPRLTPDEFDRSTGKILWPVALLQDSFSAQRGEVESLLNSLVQSGVTKDLNANITRKTQVMRETLRKQIRVVAPKEYLEGIRFLGHLANEAKWPMS